MSNYTKSTDFEAKDALPSGDSDKIIRGAEFEVEFDNIAVAVNSKADSNSPVFISPITIDGAQLTDTGSNTLVDARVAESNVTQHEAALSITESQISDLGPYNNYTFTASEITGQTELASGLAGTDELLVSDAGVLKRMDISVLQEYVDANASITEAQVSDLGNYALVGANLSTFTNDAGFITATLTTEQVQDIVGAMVTGNTETNITVTYQDSDGTLDFEVTAGGGLSIDSTVRTSTFTAVAGSIYKIDTTGGAFSMTLPATPTEGDEVGFMFVNGSDPQQEALTCGRNGSEIEDASEDLVWNVNIKYFSLQYATQDGWKVKL